MKLLLPDALHARPADLLVRRAAELPARVVVHCRGKRADARKILEVLALGAPEGRVGGARVGDDPSRPSRPSLR